MPTLESAFPFRTVNRDTELVLNLDHFRGLTSISEQPSTNPREHRRPTCRGLEIARSLGAPPELTRAVVYDHLAERSVAEAKMLTMLATIPPSRRRSQEG